MPDYGPLWTRMNSRPREPPRDLRPKLPRVPGVYAWYHEGRPVYVGKADNLKVRVGRHLSRGASLTSSAFRRNVAAHLGIASARAIYLGDYVPTAEDLARVRTFIEGCRVAWLPTTTKAGARSLESELKTEWMPPLTKM